MPASTRKQTAPAVEWTITRQRVAQAATSVLSTAGHVTFEALVISVELLKLVPDTSLTSAAKTLVVIWQAVQLVDTNRLACLRLTERCADTLLSVYEEVKDAGEAVGEELMRPISKLNESFNQVHAFLQKQIQRTFLDRYLRRDEILGQIAECDASLRDALSMFSLSIQIRILKQIQQAPRLPVQRDNTTISSCGSMDSMNTLVSTESQNDPIMGKKIYDQLPSSSDSLLFRDDATPMPDCLSPSAVVPTLQTLQTLQNSSDTAQDITDLRSLMKTALQKKSDAEMMEVLQVGRDEMPEAIRTLQRALECVADKEVDMGDVWGDWSANGEMEGSGWGYSKPWGMGFSVESRGSVGSGWRMDTLDRELIETGLDALRRMSRGPEMVGASPVWSTSRFEVDWHRRHQVYLEV